MPLIYIYIYIYIYIRSHGNLSKATSHKTAAVQPPTTHLQEPSKLDEQNMWDTAGGARMNS